MVPVIECLVKAIKDKGVRGLFEIVPGGQYAYDIATHAFRYYRERRRTAAIRDELAKVADDSTEAARKVAEDAVNRAIIDQLPYGADVPQVNPTTQPAPRLTPEQPGTAARAPACRSDRGPLEGGGYAATVLPVAESLDPEYVSIPVRGTLDSRPASGLDAQWEQCEAELPGTVSILPDRAYRLVLHPETTDRELEHLRALAGFARFEEIELAGCSRVTDAGILQLTCLRGLKVIGLAQTGVTASGVSLLLTRFPHLEGVNLAGAEAVSEAIVPDLARLRKLKRLTLPPSADGAQTRDRFARRRPLCQVA